MIRFWPPVVFRLALIAALALTAGFVLGESWGFAVAIAGLLVLIASHLWYLWRIVRWLDQPSDQPVEELPQGFGAWISVFRALRQSRRRAEGERAKLGDTLNRFIEASSALPDGIVIVDQGDRLEWCNPRASEHFGLDPARDRGYFVYNLIRQPALTDYLIRRDYGEPVVITDALRDRVFSVQLLPFQDNRRLIVSRDVSQLRRVDAMRQDFIANVSHELRTPLTVVGGFLEHLVDMPDLEAAERHRIHALMLDQARRMRRLIDDLLMLSKLETQLAPPADDTVTLDVLARAALRDTEMLSAGRHVMKLESLPELTLRGSREELESALDNLLSNAVRYTPRGGSITLSAQHEQGSLRIAVTDTGPGIDAVHIPRLTERFYRVDKSRSRETGGTGLGLAIVKHVLARHGGHLEIASTLGKGSAFTMVLPADRIAITPAPDELVAAGHA